MQLCYCLKRQSLIFFMRTRFLILKHFTSQIFNKWFYVFSACSLNRKQDYSFVKTEKKLNIFYQTFPMIVKTAEKTL